MADREKAGGGRASDVSPGIIARIAAGARAFMSPTVAKPIASPYLKDDESWMGPGQPTRPVAPDGTQARRLDYPVGINYNYIPRGSYEAIDYKSLRALSEGWDLLRTVIETRKDQLSRVPADFVCKPKPGESSKDTALRNDQDPRLQTLRDFFKWPNQENSFKDWQRMILEDLFVIDAVSVLPRWRNDGGIYGFDVIDGASISRIVDAQGRTPRPPQAAYRQILHGIPAVDMMAIAPTIKKDQLIYKPRNVRAHKLYGYSPVEQIITTVNIAIRRQLHQLEYYTDGTVPDAMIELPDTWTPDQIAQFETYWNSKFADQKERRKASFLPLGSKVSWTKDAMLKDEMDEWLARLVAFAFSIPPNALIKQLNRASAQKMSDDAKSEGLEPLMSWWTDLMNIMVQEYIGFKDIEHTFGDVLRSNPVEEAKVNDIYVRNGTKSIDEVREELELEPIGADNAIITMSGPVPVVSSLDRAEAQNKLPVHDPLELAQAQAAMRGNGGGAAPAGGKDNGDGKEKPPAKKAAEEAVWRSRSGRARMIRRSSTGQESSITY